MELRIPQGVVADIAAHARATYPEECCGFLIGREEGEQRVVLENRRTRNVHPSERNARYTIDPREVLAVDREFAGDLRHIGFYHSHVDGPARPSTFDLRLAWPYYVYAILTVRAQEPHELTAWRLDEARQDFEEVRVLVA